MADDKTAYEKRGGEQYDGPLIPFGTKVSHKPVSSKDVARLHQCSKSCFQEFACGMVLRAVEDGQETWSSWITCQLRLASNGSSICKSKKKESYCFHAQSDHYFFNFLRPPLDEMLARRNPEQDDKEDDTFFRTKKNGRDDHQIKLYVPDEQTFTMPKKCVDGMSQTRTSIVNASNLALDNFWSDEKKSLAISGIDRNNSFPNPEDEASRYKWVNTGDCQTIKETQTRKECSLEKRRDNMSRSSPRKEGSSTFHPQTQITSRLSPKLE